MYPITQDDFIQMYKRMVAGESCYIPCREDVQLTNGKVAPNCLSWGSPVAYELYAKSGQVFCRFKD